MGQLILAAAGFQPELAEPEDSRMGLKSRLKGGCGQDCQARLPAPQFMQQTPRGKLCGIRLKPVLRPDPEQLAHEHNLADVVGVVIHDQQRFAQQRLSVSPGKRLEQIALGVLQ